MRVFGFFRALPIADPDAIVERFSDLPVATGHDLLVQIMAVSINPVDCKVRQAKADDGHFTIAGWDAAGIVVATGEKVTHFRIGDEVWYAGDITRPGSNAEYQLVEEQIAGPKPLSLNFSEAAALPLTTLTAWEALHGRMRIPFESEENEGRTLLIINGAGGVGSMAIQLAKRAGLTVLTTASRPESRDWCRALGADEIIPHSELGGRPGDCFDWILCCHDTDAYFDDAARLVAPFGLICMLSSAKKSHNIQALMTKSAGVVWEYMFTPSSYRTANRHSQHEVLAAAARLVDEGAIRSTLTHTLAPLSAETLRRGHALIEQGQVIGKVVIVSAQESEP